MVCSENGAIILVSVPGMFPIAGSDFPLPFDESAEQLRHVSMQKDGVPAMTVIIGALITTVVFAAGYSNRRNILNYVYSWLSAHTVPPASIT